jgi:hypothetical protein
METKQQLSKRLEIEQKLNDKEEILFVLKQLESAIASGNEETIHKCRLTYERVRLKQEIYYKEQDIEAFKKHVVKK